MNFRIRLKLPRSFLGISFKAVFKKREGHQVMGITNRVANYWIPFLDYDDISNKTFLFEELATLQENFLLGNAYLFRTKKGYHVVFLDLVEYDTLLEILESSNCDKHYATVPQTNGNQAWILRLTPKGDNFVYFDDVLPGNNVRPISAPHKKLLHTLGVPENGFFRNDKEAFEGKQLVFARYEA